jgi:Domain of unknown function (DUF4340)
MSPKTFLALLAVTAVSVAGAGYAVVLKSRSEAAPAAASAPLFPDLLAQANNIGEVTVTTAKGKATIRRDGERWVIAEKDSYPVPVDKVRKLVGGLAGLRLLEAKTDQADRYARLEVEDVTQKDAKSRLVTLVGADGKALASLLVGKRNYDMGMNGPGGLYVRQPGEARSWLAEGALEVPEAAIDWPDRTVVNVAAEGVTRVGFQPTSGAALTATKADRTAKDLTLAPIPEGKTADPDAVNRLAAVFAGLTFDDVRKDALPADATPKATAEVATFDGLTARAALFDVGGTVWARLTATGTAGSDAEKQAKAINDRVAGWLYKLPDYKIPMLQPKIDDLLKKGDGTS